ncbi:MAG TPA: hypothetical protein VGM72_03135 [Micropepsaceae bacterium]|jgi:hypothetical protein
MSTLSPALDLFLYQFLRFFNPRQGYCWIYLAGGLFFALCVMLWRRRNRSRITPARFCGFSARARFGCTAPRFWT